MTSPHALGPENLKGALPPLVSLMRRYAFAYTCCHDFAECRRLMVDDYVLCMGEYELRGRDGPYVTATAKQYRQFPGLGLTVHDLVVGEDRIAMHFTEHGRSALSNRPAVWTGVSLYRWNGEKLTECRVEQDYFARRDQLRADTSGRMLPPAVDPWTEQQLAPDANTDQLVREWLRRGGLADAPMGSLNDEYCAPPCRPRLEESQVSILDMFTAGPRAAFHAVIRGRYSGGFDHIAVDHNVEIPLYVAGVATVRNGSVQVRAVTDRIAFERRLMAASDPR